MQAIPYIYILPELFLSVAIMSLLMLGVFIKKSFKLVSLLTISSLAFAIILVLNQPNEMVKIFNDSYIIDKLSIFMKVLTLLFCLFVLLSSKDYIKNNDIDKIEYPIIILASTLGMILMISSYDLIVFYLGLELQSLCLYILASFRREDVRSSEAGLKYFVLSALASGLLLYGCSLIYGFTGSTNFETIATNLNEANKGAVFGIVFIIVGLAFKVSAVPFHMWSPDVYQGAPTTVTAFLCTAPKVAGFGALLNIFIVAFMEIQVEWQNLFWILAALTMTVGNISALMQSHVKRMLAFSSVSHAGYLVLGVLVLNSVGLSAVLFYLVVYSVMNLGAFGIILLLEKDNKGLAFEDYRGFSAQHPWMAGAMALFMISLAGFPPTGGFVAKYGLLSSAVSEGYIWLVIIAVLNTLVSAYYYLRLIVNMYMQEEKESPHPVSGVLVLGLIGLLAVIVLTLGITPEILLKITSEAATTVF